MTGEELYLKAQNGGKGFPAWEKLPAGQKGLWENAVREIQHEKDKLLVRVALHERKEELERVIAFICERSEVEREFPMKSQLLYRLAGMLERREHI